MRERGGGGKILKNERERRRGGREREREREREGGKNERERERESDLFVGWLLNVPTTCTVSQGRICSIL